MTHDSSCGLVQIRIFSDDRRGLAAQFKRTRNEVLRGGGCDDATDGGGTDEEDMTPSFLKQASRVAHGAQADAVSLRVEVFRNELSKQQGAGLGVFGGLQGDENRCKSKPRRIHDFC